MSREFWIDPDDNFAATNNFGKRAIHVREVTPRDLEREQATLKLVEALKLTIPYVKVSTPAINYAQKVLEKNQSIIFEALANWEKVNK